MKYWVIVQFENGKRTLWRDYGNVAWGSPAYAVLGFVSGRSAAARRFLAHLPPLDRDGAVPEWDNVITLPNV